MNKFLNGKSKDFIFKMSAMLILIAAVVYLFNEIVAPYIMIVGVIGFAATTFLTPYPGKSFRGRRLYNIQIFGIAFMAMGAYLMFTHRNEWVVAMLVAALLILYAWVLMPRVYRQEQEKEKDNK
jgi:membrane protein implicated in regulation of membrane protease activity